MSRTKPAAAPVDLDLEDDEVYRGVLVSAEKVKSRFEDALGKPKWQIKSVWELRQGAKLTDWCDITVSMGPGNVPSKLRQMLNALGEKGKGEELWFDTDTLEWGYDLDGDDSTPAFANLRPGLVVSFIGENREDSKGVKRYKITGYRAIKAKK